MPKPLSTDFDVTIVGAGPAGTAAAYDLSLAGKSVLLIDRHTFPRHKACAGGLTVKTLRALRYPVDPVISRRFKSLEIGRGLDRCVRLRGRREICVTAVRADLDDLCLAKTRAAGARFQTIDKILSVREHGDFVDLWTAEGRIRSGFLIGADGARSRIRRLTGEFAGIRYGFAIEGTLAADPAEQPRMAFDFNVVPSGYGWLFPKNNHTSIGLFTGNPGITLKKRDLFAYARRKLGRTDIANLSGHAMGMGGWRYRPRSRRILLAGDAAGLVDPLLGEGIYNAVHSGQLAARAIASSESSHQPAGALYDRLLKSIRRDLWICHLSAAWFYRLPTLGHLALTSRPVRYALLKGFGRGWTLGRIGLAFYRLPFLTN